MGTQGTDSTLLFLGAGFSRELGMPLVQHITNKILLDSYLIRHSDTSAFVERRTEVPGLEMLPSLMVKEGMNYEEAVAFLEESREEGGPIMALQTDPLRFWMIDSIDHALVYLHRQYFDQQYAIAELYRGIEVLAAENHPLWVFSLNHDLCVEIVASRSQIPVHYESLGRRPFTQIGHRVRGAAGVLYDTTSFKKASKPSAYFRPGDFGINLVKLHGGVNEFTRSSKRNENVLVRLFPAKPSPRGWQEVIHVLERCSVNALGLPNGLASIRLQTWSGTKRQMNRTILSGSHKWWQDDRFVVPPPIPSPEDGYFRLTYQKGDERSPEANQFSSMAPNLFRSVLHSTHRVLAIGYSFGDPHINDILIQWLQVSPARRIAIVGPHATEIPDCLKECDGQVELYAMGTVAYLTSLMGEEKRDMEGGVSINDVFRREQEIAEALHAYHKREENRLTKRIDPTSNLESRILKLDDSTATRMMVQFGERVVAGKSSIENLSSDLRVVLAKAFQADTSSFEGIFPRGEMAKIALAQHEGEMAKLVLILLSRIADFEKAIDYFVRNRDLALLRSVSVTVDYGAFKLLQHFVKISRDGNAWILEDVEFSNQDRLLREFVALLVSYEQQLEASHA